MQVVSSIADLSAWRDALSPALRCGFVPTMGALHAGHLSLLGRARGECDRVITSVFVNPMQFAAGEDLSTYPRDAARDTELVRASAGADLLWFASADEMYPPGFDTQVLVPSLSQPLCGRERRGHFAGVALVVLKLFHLVRPRVAYFGRKDYQQLAVIRRLVLDLNVPVSIVGCPTVREADGLAMSSRNQRLTAAGRRIAPGIYRALSAARERFLGGERGVAPIIAAARELLAGAPAVQIEYLELVDGKTLAAAAVAEADCVLAAAVRIDGVRLIDNVRLGGDIPGDRMEDSS